MNSPIKLPPLPPIPREVVIDEDPDSGAVYGQDNDELRAWATAYAEQAVREALAEASSLCNRKFIAMAEGGFPREASAARKLTAEIKALIPENNHAEGADQ